MPQPLTDHSKEASHDRWKLGVMWFLLAAFLVAVPMMFVHPGIVIALFWVGLITLAVSSLIARLFGSHGHAA